MTTKKKQALEAALSALESERIMAADVQGNYTVEVTPKRIIDAIAKVKAALAEPEQEPAHIYAAAVKHTAYFFWREENCDNFIRQFTASTPVMKVRHLVADGKPSPQPREWQELSDADINRMFTESASEFLHVFKDDVKYISAVLRAKNGG